MAVPGYGRDVPGCDPQRFAAGVDVGDGSALAELAAGMSMRLEAGETVCTDCGRTART